MPTTPSKPFTYDVLILRSRGQPPNVLYSNLPYDEALEKAHHHLGEGTVHIVNRATGISAWVGYRGWKWGTKHFRIPKETIISHSFKRKTYPGFEGDNDVD